MRAIIIIPFLLLLAGCAVFEFEDEALHKDLSETVNRLYQRMSLEVDDWGEDDGSYESDVHNVVYGFDYLHNKWSDDGHFVSDEALAQIEIEKGKFLQWMLQQKIQSALKQVKRELLEREQAEREAERKQIEFETKRKKLIQNSNGTLRDKSAQQVKKLVDSWREGSWRCKEKPEFFSLETFYKVFGKPDRKQFLSSQFESDSYYFLYNCKDGVVQIKVHAEWLDDNGIVLIEDLNIF